MLLVRGNEYNKIYNKHKDTIDKVKALNQTKGISVDSISLVSLLAVRANDLPVRIIMFHPVTAPFGLFLQNWIKNPWGMWWVGRKLLKWDRNWSNKIDIRLATWGMTLGSRSF